MNANKKKKKVEEENESSLIHDPNQLDLINNLNSTKLIDISEAFEKFPQQSVDVETFVNIMKEILGDTQLVDRDSFVSELVDLYFRAKKGALLKFEDLTGYLIDHEIKQGENFEQPTNFEYSESSIKDSDTHNNYIQKIFYIEDLDKVLVYEQNMRYLKFYNGETMKKEFELICSANILSVEYITDKQVIAVSTSDQYLLFYEAVNI